MHDIIHEGHTDKLDYAWWEAKHGHILLPKTIKSKNNFVLTHEELAVYESIIIEMKHALDKEHARVVNTLTALRIGRSPAWADTPTCFTIAHIMEFMIVLAKNKLATVELLNWIAKERIRERGQASTPETHEGESSPHS